MIKLTLFNYNFSISLLFKVFFIILLILITIFLLYQELKIIDEKEKLIDKPFMESSSKPVKTFKEIVIVFIPALMAYHTFGESSSSTQHRLSEAEIAEILKLHTQYEQIVSKVKENDMINGTKYITTEAEYLSKFSERLVKFLALQDSRVKESKILRELEKINDLKKNKAEGESISTEDSSLINREDLFKSSLKIADSNYNEDIKSIDDKLKSILDIKKSSVFGFDNIEDFLKTLTQEELLAFSGLLLNQLILAHVISIILILYGDYLIKRFDLENRYPKIAKFIQLRRKLQSYYLKLSFSWIIVALLPQIFMHSSIILSKLIELFN